MLDQAIQDTGYMARAIQLAERGLYTTMPNPRVGCILVKDNCIIGEGWHQKAGEGHAEVNALRDAGDEATGATAYVTLEPCSHQGKTPPCAMALIKAGVSRVVVAMEDPNPQVAGSGHQALRKAGIEVVVGILALESAALNPGYIKRMATGMPFVRCKLAMSLDGRTAMSSGESQWITGAGARSDVQRLRARSCAIVTGSGSILSDDSSLTVREAELNIKESRAAAEIQPWRVVLDSHYSISPSAKVFQQTGQSILVVAQRDTEKEESFSDASAVKFWCFPSDSGQIDLKACLKQLASEQCNEVLIEAGATLAGEALALGLIDEIVVYIAPSIMGGDARPLFELPMIKQMNQKIELSIKDIRAIGEDWRIVAVPQ